jgi:alpha-tubulin suppressor-like RCC1 family protein
MSTASLPTLQRLAVVSTFVLLAACGGGGGGGGEETPPPPGVTEPPPAPPPAPDTATPMVAAGDGFSVALEADGTASSWGDQGVGQLGNGVTTGSSQRVPQQVLDVTGLRALVAGRFHALARRADGRVLAWGSNGDGQLGLGAFGGSFATPQPVDGLADVVAVAAGRAHSLALRGDGRVFAWGSNVAGQLGTNDTEDRGAPTLVAGLTDVVAIAAGGQQSFALRGDGSVWGWGNNGDGQLGLGDRDGRLVPTRITTLDGAGIVQVAAGRFHTLARDADGRVWGWGFSEQGQAGRETVGGDSFTTYLLPGLVEGVAGVAALAAGDEHSIALRSDGTVRTWGHGGNGRLGNGSDGVTQSTFVPQDIGVATVTAVSAGRDHTLIALADGRVGCFGSNFLSQCGRIETTVDFLEPLEVGPGFDLTP